MAIPALYAQLELLLAEDRDLVAAFNQLAIVSYELGVLRNLFMSARILYALPSIDPTLLSTIRKQANSVLERIIALDKSMNELEPGWKPIRRAPL